MDLLIEVVLTVFSLLKPIYMVLNIFAKKKELPEVLTMEYLEGEI